MADQQENIHSELSRHFRPHMSTKQAPDFLDRRISYNNNNIFIITIVASLCRVYRLNAEELATKWDAFAFFKESSVVANGNDKIKVTLSEPMLEEFNEYLRERLTAAVSSVSASSAAIGGINKPVLDQKSLKSRKSTTGLALNKNNFQSYMSGFLAGGQKLPVATPRQTLKQRLATQTGSDILPSSGSKTNTGHPNMESPSTMQQRNFESAPMSKFMERDQRGKVEDVLNPQLRIETLKQSDKPRVEVAVHPDCLTGTYRPMYEKLLQKTGAIDQHVDDMGALIADENDFVSEIKNPKESSQSLVKTVGRIFSESDMRMNDGSVMLETSRRVGGGSRVRLNLNGIAEFALFPGQVVGVEGMNNTESSDIFTATRLFQPSVPQPESTEIRQLFRYNYDSKYLGGEGLKVLTASGPFALDDSVQYEPFQALMDVLKKEVPDVVILCGPFVDDRHPMALAGKLAQFSEMDLFTQLMEKLGEFLKFNRHSMVILVPSDKDATQPWMFFPQPAFQLSELKSPFFQNRENIRLLERIVCLPNPCVFTINEIYFGVCTQEVLYELGSEEIFRQAPMQQQRDRIARLATHILQQRSFYPLLPSHAQTMLDFEHWAKHAQLPVRPDILILPSKLMHFAKVVEGVIVMNPGFVARKQSGGTYAMLSVLPIAKDDFPQNVQENTGDAHGNEDDEKFMYHGVDSRTKVEIIRI